MAFLLLEANTPEEPSDAMADKSAAKETRSSKALENFISMDASSGPVRSLRGGAVAVECRVDFANANIF